MGYMAPEQVCDEPVDRRADVFALGVILYELTTRSRLFTGTEVEIMTSVVEHDAPRPSSRASGYPAALERVVLRALARRREDRVANAKALSRALEGAGLTTGLDLGAGRIREWLESA